MSRKGIRVSPSSITRPAAAKVLTVLACAIAVWAVMALPAESKKPGITFELGSLRTEFLNLGDGFGDARVTSECPAGTVAISGRHFYAIDGAHHFGDEHPYFTRAAGVREGGYYAEVGRAGSTANTDPGLQVVVQALCARR